MRTRPTVCAAVLLALVSTAMAEDKKPAPIDGTWKWTYKTRDGKDAEAAVKLKQEGDKLTGAYVARDGAETPIEDGKITGEELTFTVNRTIGDEKMKFDYKGKLAGDTITGRITFGREKPTPHDWEAKRAK